MRGNAAKGMNPVQQAKVWNETIRKENQDHLAHPLNNCTPAEARAADRVDRTTFYAPSWPLVQARYAGAAGVGSALCTLADYYGEGQSKQIPPAERDGYLLHPEIPHPVPLHPYTGWDYWPAGSLESMRKRTLPGVVLDAGPSAMLSTRLQGARPLHPGTGGELNKKMRRVQSLPEGQLPTITVPGEDEKRHPPGSARSQQPMTGRSSLRSFSARSQARFGPICVGADLTRKIDRSLVRRGIVDTGNQKPAYRPGDTNRRDNIWPPKTM